MPKTSAINGDFDSIGFTPGGTSRCLEAKTTSLAGSGRRGGADGQEADGQTEEIFPRRAGNSTVLREELACRVGDDEEVGDP